MAPMANWPLLPLCILLCAQLLAQPVVHLRGASGEWIELPAPLREGRVVVTLSPQLMDWGQATLVLAKPEWMVLQDGAPPSLVGVRVGDTELALGHALSLSTAHGDVVPLYLRFRDDANPVDPESLCLLGLPAPVKVERSATGPPNLTEEFVVTLPHLAPGTYEGSLCVADLSPQANLLRLPWRISVFGGVVDPERQRISLSAQGGTYRVEARPRVPIVIGDRGPEAYLTAQIAGTWLYPRGIAKAELILDQPDHKIWRLTTSVGDADGNPMDFPGGFEFDLELRYDLPCLLVRSRCLNNVADGEVYNFWGWLPGDGYQTAQGTRRWSMAYQEIGKVGWVYLPSADPGQPGLGWISPLVFGESRFGTMLLYTSPMRVPVPKGEWLSMEFALMPAHNAREVAEVAARLEELAVWAAPSLAQE